MKYSNFLIFLVVLMFIHLVSAGSTEEGLVVSLNLNYKNGIVTLGGANLLQVQESFELKAASSGDYSLKAFSFLDEELYKTFFDFDLRIRSIAPREWFDSEGNQIYIPGKNESGNIISNAASKAIFLPYFKNGKYIEIYNSSNQKILTVDISLLAVCNQNKICDNQESKEVCPEDCLGARIYQESSNFSCDGCLFGSICHSVGDRTLIRYCSKNREFIGQREENFDCDNNFECLSNLCVSGKCTTLSLFQRIIENIKNLF